MKVSYLIICLALLSLFSVPVSADLNIVSTPVIHTNDSLVWGLDWSPDGNSIAYVAYDDSRNQQIFTINVDGTGKKQVTNTTNKKWSVAWFDDNISYIAYDNDNHNLEKIFLVKPDGSGKPIKLLDDGTRQGRAVEDKPPAIGGASWNPKTKTVLFTSFDAAGNEKIYQVNLNGTGEKPLINDSFRQWNPQWSPDGGSFVYISYDSTYHIQLFTANADGSGKKQIQLDEIKKSDPDWGQGGIVYVSYENATSSGEQIFYTDSSGKKPLFPDDGFRQLNPRWSRDGTKILFVESDPQGNQTIRVLNLQKPAATSPSPTPTPTATGITTPTPTPTPTPTGTPEIKETPVKSTINDVVSSMLLVLGLIVVLMLVILFISNLMNKKK